MSQILLSRNRSQLVQVSKRVLEHRFARCVDWFGLQRPLWPNWQCPVDFVRLEAQSHGAPRLRQDEHIIQFPHDSLNPHPTAEVTRPQVDHGQTPAQFGLARLEVVVESQALKRAVLALHRRADHRVFADERQIGRSELSM